MTPPIVWIHGDCLSPHNPALLAYPQAPALFVFDEGLLEEWEISLKRIVFIYECLLELPVTIRKGAVASEVAEFARWHHAQHIVTTPSPSPHFLALCQQLQPEFQLEILPVPEFLATDSQLDLKRFSRYWQVAEQYAFGDWA